MKITLKTLSIKEPYAGLILCGAKLIETRTYSTDYRGLLLLHCSKTPKSPISGKAFAIVKLTKVRLMTKEDEVLACCEIYPDAYSWTLEHLTPIVPIEMKGSLGIYNTVIEKNDIKVKR